MELQMKLLKEKKVKKCMCGKEPETTIVRTDWAQAISYLATASLFFFIVWIVLYILPFGGEPGPIRDIIPVGLLVLLATIFTIRFALQTHKEGHTWHCSLRIGLFKLTGDI